MELQSQQDNLSGIIKTTPRDFFFHLGAMISLYSVIGALFNLLFTVIDYYFPDNLAGNFYGNPLAWAISTLIILTPVSYLLEWIISKDMKAIPGKSETWIARWRIYLTLFLAGGIIIGDLIILINTFLNGEISERFILKFLTVFVVLGIVFSHYLLERLNKSVTARNAMAYIGIFFIIASIVIGFMTVGSPYRQRSLRYDNQRINDLQSIQYQVTNFWQQKGRLPANLAEAQDPLYSTTAPIDPENRNTYEYSIIENTPMQDFKLCANFSLETPDIKGRGEYYGGGNYSAQYIGGIRYDNDDNWKHEKGRVCFTRIIDPERYPVNKPINPPGI